MTEIWAARMSRRAALRVLAALILATCAVVLFFVYQKRLIHNAFRGPFILSAADLAGIHRAEDAKTYFVKVTGSNSFDTELVKWSVETKNGAEVKRSIAAEYYALIVGGKSLIVETPKLRQARDLTVVGTLSSFPPDLRTMLVQKLGRQVLRKDYYPFYLKAGSIRGQAYAVVAVLLLIEGALLIAARPSLGILSEPGSGRVMKKLGSWGDPYQVSAAIERETREPPTRRIGFWKVTRSYLVLSRPFAFDIFRFEDILWAYRQETKHTIHFIIPTGSTFRARLVCSNGTAVVRGFRGRRRGVDELLALVAERTPWALSGFSRETLFRFKKDPDRFREEIEKAKREFLGR
jgi:hypothetical protein